MTDGIQDLVIDLGIKNVYLQKKLQELEQAKQHFASLYREYQSYMDDIMKIVGYQGHPGNVARIIQEKLEETNK